MANNLDLSNLPPETMAALAAVLQGQMPLPTKPKQPQVVTCYDKRTGEKLELYRIDFNEHMKLGNVVMAPGEADAANPATIQAVADQAQAGNAFARSQLEALDVEILRKLWKDLHDGEDAHPRLGKARLVDEIIATREALGVLPPKGSTLPAAAAAGDATGAEATAK